MLRRTYGLAYTASPECILDIPRPKKDISDVFYSNGQSKPKYDQILDKFTRKRVFSDAWTQVSFDKNETLRLLKSEAFSYDLIISPPPDSWRRSWWNYLSMSRLHLSEC